MPLDRAREAKDWTAIERTESRRSFSSQSSYSDGEDVSDLILKVPLSHSTQRETLYDSEESVPSTGPSSGSSLGKRKATDIFDPSPRKALKSIQDTSNHFLDTCNKDPPVVRCDPVHNKPVVIAHSPRHQPYFDKLGFGVQFEIARLHTRGLLKYENVPIPALSSLMGPNATAAPNTAQFLKLCDNHENETYAHAFAKEMAVKSPWEELDIEESILRDDPLAGLGFSDKYPDWYGGKVHFRAKLDDKTQYRILLERAELGPSYRFARRFGSTSFLKVKVSSRIINKPNNKLVEFFSRPFILNGRVYRSFYAKDENVFMFKTNEIVHEDTLNSELIRVSAGSADSPGLSLLAFLNWHNSLEVNNKQSMTKWASRFSLGLSTSVPSLQFKPSNIRHEADIVSPAGSDMTDGAGYINKLPLLQMQSRFEWDTFPTAVQCRLAGSKGLLHIHPNARDDAQEDPVAHLRPSQIKIKYPSDQPQDPAMLILDLLCPSHMKVPGRLSHEITVNLAENCVGHSVFTTLFKEGLAELIGNLMKWDDTIELWKAVARKGSVLAARRAREAGGESRARGLGEREADDIESDDEDGLQQMENAIKQRSSAWWWDELSGCPSSLEETVMVLLDAGFKPTDCAVLREKLRKIVFTDIDHYTRKCKVNVPMSCTAFIVPDPYGVLGPREVQIKSSRRNFKTADGIESDIILGDVLLGRHPTKLPTDVQKFRAVQKAKLRHLTDVVVCSTQGDRRQADLLSGGDYDGDKVLAIWQPEIVIPFVNADLRHSHEPEDVAACFDCEQGTVSEFLNRMGPRPAEEQILALQKVLLSTIRDGSVVGKYSSFHECAAYHLGYDHERTIHLAYMFCKVLDGVKTGLKVNPRVWKEDRDKWERTSPPEWKEKTGDDKDKGQWRVDNRSNVTRLQGLPRFIMDRISHFAKEERDRQLIPVMAAFNSSDKVVVDAHLTEPWLNALKLADRFVEEEGCDRMKLDLTKIEDHVHELYDKHREQVNVKNSPTKRDKRAPFSDLPIEVRQDKMRALSNEFVSKPRLEDVMMDEAQIRRLRASYAYLYDSQKTKTGWTRFPWDVAMRELCAIKAHALGPSKTMTAGFYQRFFIK